MDIEKENWGNKHKVHRKLLVIYKEHSSFENICEYFMNMSVKMRMHKYEYESE